MVAWIISDPDKNPRLPGRYVQEPFILTFGSPELTESKTLSGTARPTRDFYEFC